MRFDPDALLAALPFREITTLVRVRIRSSIIQRATGSSLGQRGEYNGFSGRERTRTAEVSKKLIAAAATIRHAKCDICGEIADH
jgi:hypothetical protein